MIQVKRVYELAAKSDGQRFLVERLWPRGIKKEALALTGWCKEAAPSHPLRKWFNHDPTKWKEFQRRYRAELEARPETWQPLLEAAQTGNLTLLFSAHDTAHNNAVVLKTWLEERLKAGPKNPDRERKSSCHHESNTPKSRRPAAK
ncbi:MAG TPA: DUF488 domain-containing protein [Verrucomicrobiae bacterium]|nr:DUF488 domain-containing protein [Verrucomicrobiae bacterium]